MNIEMIKAASQRLQGHLLETPLLQSDSLNEIAGRRIFIKAENLQKTGSFKARGAWSAISSLTQEALKKGVVAASSGNHAQGIAFSSKYHNTRALVFMPSNAPETKIRQTIALGAEVQFYDRAAELGSKLAKQHSTETGMTLINPFDDAQVIAGQGTIGLELARQIQHLKVDATEVLVCCGGGGLTAGIALALESEMPHIQCRTVEPVGFDDSARSIANGSIQENSRTDGSICDSLLTLRPGELTFPIVKRLCGPGLTINEQECLKAMSLAFTHLKIVLEPGGAIALAAALFYGDLLNTNDVIVTASGGNVDRSLFQKMLKDYG